MKALTLIRVLLICLAMASPSQSFAQEKRPEPKNEPSIQKIDEIPKNSSISPPQPDLAIPDTTLERTASAVPFRPWPWYPSAAEKELIYVRMPNSELRSTWGDAKFRVYASGERQAPNGGRYKPSFSLDLNTNLALWTDRKLYFFTDLRLFGQASNSDSNPVSSLMNSQDTNPRQINLIPGLAWNYCDTLELRLYGYGNFNLDRGNNSKSFGVGSNDGLAIENRYYFLFTDFQRGIYNYVSLGYYFGNDLTGLDGNAFIPGFYMSFSLIKDVFEEQVWVFGQFEAIADVAAKPKLLNFDFGLLLKPFNDYPRFYFQVGIEGTGDLDLQEQLFTGYFSMRLNF
jgi:hypothetical protein